MKLKIGETLFVKSDYIPQFEYQPQFELGISSNEVNIKLKGRVIGYIEAKNIPKFEKGDVTLFEPVKDWKSTFSPDLIEYLKLSY